MRAYKIPWIKIHAQAKWWCSSRKARHLSVLLLLLLLFLVSVLAASLSHSSFHLAIRRCRCRCHRYVCFVYVYIVRTTSRYVSFFETTRKRQGPTMHAMNGKQQNIDTKRNITQHTNNKKKIIILANYLYSCDSRFAVLLSLLLFFRVCVLLFNINLFITRETNESDNKCNRTATTKCWSPL